MDQNQQTNKFCKFCGKEIAADAVICTHCGRQVEEIKQAQPQNPNIVINNSNSSVNTNVNKNTIGGIYHGKPKNKWVALCLCLALGYFGAHKFYEGKTGMGIVYLFTCGLFFFGIIADTLALLGKPTTYYV